VSGWLALEQFEFSFDLGAGDLGIPNGGLHGRQPFRGDLTKVVRELFQGPARIKSAMGKVVP